MEGPTNSLAGARVPARSPLLQPGAAGPAKRSRDAGPRDFLPQSPSSRSHAPRQRSRTEERLGGADTLAEPLPWAGSLPPQTPRDPEMLSFIADALIDEVTWTLEDSAPPAAGLGKPALPERSPVSVSLLQPDVPAFEAAAGAPWPRVLSRWCGAAGEGRAPAVSAMEILRGSSGVSLSMGGVEAMEA